VVYLTDETLNLICAKFAVEIITFVRYVLRICTSICTAELAAHVHFRPLDCKLNSTLSNCVVASSTEGLQQHLLQP